MSNGSVAVGGGAGVPTILAVSSGGGQSAPVANGVVPLSDSVPQVLAFTGSELQYLLAAGLSVLAVGLILVLISRTVEPLPNRSL